MTFLILSLALIFNLINTSFTDDINENKNSETILKNFDKFTDSVTGNFYVYTKKEVKTHSLDEAMSMCPKGTRLLTLHNEGIEQDVLKMTALIRGKFLLAMSNRMNKNVWLYSQSLYSPVEKNNWWNIDMKLNEKSCAYIDKVNDFKWKKSVCDGLYNLLCMKDPCQPVWLSGSGVVHDEVVAHPQASSLHECMLLCQYAQQQCIGVVETEASSSYNCLLVSSLSNESIDKDTRTRYFMKHNDNKCHVKLSAKVVPSSNDKRTDRRTKRELPEINEVDVTLESIQPFNGKFVLSNQKKSCTEGIFMSCIILCSAYATGIICFRIILFFITFLRNKAIRKEEINLAKKQEEIVAKLEEDEHAPNDS